MEITVISGKGGTGKTTIAVAMYEILSDASIVDCDVDAPNVYLTQSGDKTFTQEFFGGKKAEVNEEKCIECGICSEKCKFGAISNGVISLEKCEGCGVCTVVCPQKAISLYPYKNAEINIFKNEKGKLTLPEMEVGSDASGRLVTQLRKVAKSYNDSEITIIDGSPGIGCPVIASVTGVSKVLIVTEPTLSGLSDLKRIINVCMGLGVSCSVCINKYDLNSEIAEDIEKYCEDMKVRMIGVIPFDKTVMKAVNQRESISKHKDSKAYEAIVKITKVISNNK